MMTLQIPNGAVRAVASAVAGTTLLCAAAAPALALHNPLVAVISPVGAHGAHGRATFFQLGNDVLVTVILRTDRPGTQSVGIHRGTCARFEPRPDWVVVGVGGTTQETRLPRFRLNRLLGHVLVVHARRDRSSPVIGCAAIRDRS